MRGFCAARLGFILPLYERGNEGDLMEGFFRYWGKAEREGGVSDEPIYG